MTADTSAKSHAFEIAIAAAGFNDEIVDLLLADAVGYLGDSGIEPDVVHVPGAVELPLAAKKLAESGRYAAVICLGAVIKGDTDHYEYVCRAATDGILRAGLDTGVPVIFGVLTCQTEELAMERAKTKGGEAARAALDMVKVMQEIADASSKRR